MAGRTTVNARIHCDGWSGCLSYNLLIAGSLWAAWYGGARTVIEDEEGCLYVRGDHSDVFEAEAEPRRPHLTLVP